MPPNITKIKKEFTKLKILLSRLLYSIEAIFILFFIIVIAIAIYAINHQKNTIIDHLPDNLTAIIYYSPIKNNTTASNFFISQIDKFLGDVSQYKNEILSKTDETAIIFFKKDGKNCPILILNTPIQQNATTLWTSKNGLIQEIWDEKFIVVAKEPEILKNLNQENFKHQRTLKLFKQKNSLNMAFYLNSEKIEKTNNPIDEAILTNLNNEIFIGIKEKDNNFEMKIADTEGNEIISSNLTNKKNTAMANNDIIFSSYIPLNLSEIFTKNNLPDIPSIEKAHITLLKNPSAIDNIVIKNPHDKLLLNGKNSPYYYILSFENTDKTQKGLEDIKTIAINYLDEIVPEEKIVNLPDGTLMTELWANPERFEFKESPLDGLPAPASRLRRQGADRQTGGWGVLNDDTNAISWDLSAPQLNFELAYAEIPDRLLLSNSKDALKTYLTTNCNEELTKKTGQCPASKTNNFNNDKNFYINTNHLKTKSEIFKILNSFGDYANGMTRK